MQDAEQSQPTPILVEPHSAARELTVILVLLFDLVLLATLRANAMERHRVGPTLEEFEISSEELSADERLLYQALLGSVPDIAFERETDAQAWPSPHRLMESAIPPFELAFLPAHLRGLRIEQPAAAPAFTDYLFRFDGSKEELGEQADRTSSGGALVLRIIDREAVPDPLFHPHPHLPREGEDGRWGTQIWHHEDPSALHTGAELIRGGWRWILPRTLPNSESP